MPYGYGDWYWNPSRAIPGEVITEFPFFTFTYADLHAHMIALPITLLVLGWAVSMLLRQADWKAGLANKGWIPLLGSLLFGGLIIGTLRPTNTWDLPTYLVFTAAVLVYVCWKYAALPVKFLPSLPAWLRKTHILRVGNRCACRICAVVFPTLHREIRPGIRFH